MSDEAAYAARWHPRVMALGRDPTEQLAVCAFAGDLARFLVGDDAATLGALARVVTAVAGRELADPRRLCRGNDLLAAEAAARATESLWPWLREALEEEGKQEPPPDARGQGEGEGTEGEPEPEPGAGEDDEQGEGEGASEDEDEDEEGESDAESGESDVEEGESENEEGEAEAEAEAEPPSEADAREGRMGQRLSDSPALADALSAASNQALDGALEAADATRQLARLMPGMGWSLSPGQLQREVLADLPRLAALLAKLPQLQRLADALGRVEGAERRSGTEHGGSAEVVGVHLGGEVAHALPSELALLGDPDTEDLFHQRLLERRLVSLELAGEGMDGVTTPEEQGPVIACIDTSASMSGAPEVTAKALVLAICRRALPRGRAVHLIAFGGQGERTEIRLRGRRAALSGLLDFLALAFDGGTDFDGPLLRAVELLEEQELARADILVITDGRAIAHPSIVERVTRTKQERGLRVWSVVIGSQWLQGVAPFSDKVWTVASGGAADAMGLVQSVVR